MKKFLFVLLGVFILSGISAGLVQADDQETDVPVPTKSQRFVKAKKAEIREEIKEKVEAAKASRSAALADRKKEKISEYWERLKTRLLILIERQEKLLARMSSRVEKIESEEGLDLSEVKDGIADAKESLVIAKADLAAADDTLVDVLESENPREAFKVVRDTVYEIRRIIINVHTSLAQMIGEIRGLRSGGEIDVSVTVTPTSTVAPTATEVPAATATPTP